MRKTALEHLRDSYRELLYGWTANHVTEARQPLWYLMGAEVVSR